MEYIRETLERQQAALRRLLLGERTGGSPEAGREAPPAGDRLPPQESRTEQRAFRELAAQETAELRRGSGASADESGRAPPGERETRASAQGPEAWEMLDQALLRRSARRWKETVGDTELAGAGAPAAPASSARRRYPPAEADRAGSGSSGQPEEIFVNAGAPAVTWRTDGREGAEAKALSRAFQRDARRYDGGFRLY